MFNDDSGSPGQADFKRRHVDGEVRETSGVLEKWEWAVRLILLVPVGRGQNRTHPKVAN